MYTTNFRIYSTVLYRGVELQTTTNHYPLFHNSGISCIVWNVPPHTLFFVEIGRVLHSTSITFTRQYSATTFDIRSFCENYVAATHRVSEIYITYFSILNPNEIPCRTKEGTWHHHIHVDVDAVSYREVPWPFITRLSSCCAAQLRAELS